MATKGGQGTGEMARQIALTIKGQEEKRLARQSKRKQVAQPRASMPCVTPYVQGEGPAIQALFSATRKVLAGNHISRDPAEILKRSHEMKRAKAVHGYNACLQRVYDACIKSNMSEQDAAHFANEACR